MKTLAMSMLLFVVSLLIATCGGSDGSSSTPTDSFSDTSTTTGEAGDFSMGGGSLGGNAVTTLLAQEVLTIEETAGSLAWVAHEIRLDDGESLEHSHEFAFVYAKEKPHVLTKTAEGRQLRPAEAAVIPSGMLHRHGAVDSPSLFWEVRLAAPGSAPPPNTSNARTVFESMPLEGVPERPLAAFVHVLVPPGGQTSVHTHPGPELIYQLSGNIEYENALIGTKEMGPGQIEGIPPGVAVQKRNGLQDDAQFLSWFLVDTAEPFASPARFSIQEVKSENIALLQQGARVIRVSSNYGNGSDDSTFGADKALDGDPSTGWSSNGDGDNAWIEIELPTETRVASIGFWTRTMGTSAETFSFRLITDRGEVYGPFDLPDAASIHYFDTDFTAKHLRFENVSSSGGNTGAIEIEVYGEPVP